MRLSLHIAIDGVFCDLPVLVVSKFPTKLATDLNPHPTTVILLEITLNKITRN